MGTQIIYHTLETLHALCNEVGECWEWTKSINSAKLPQTRHAGKITNVRRLAYELNGGKIKSGYVVTPRCCNYKCINPACSRQLPLSEFISIKSKNRPKSITTRKKLSEAGKKRAKLSFDLLDEIKKSDKSGRQWAKEVGVSQKTIWSALNNKTWQEYGSPWSGLGARK